VLPADGARVQTLARCQGTGGGGRRYRARRATQASPPPIAATRRAGPILGATLMELPLIVEIILKAVVVLAAFLTLPLAVGQTEHKLMGHMQGRLGPMEAGPHGIAQLIAD